MNPRDRTPGRILIGRVLTKGWHGASRRCGAALVLGFSLLAISGATRDWQMPILRIPKAEFAENLVPRADVAGTVRVGLLTGTPVRAVDPRQLVVRIPDGAVGHLCIDIRSANGEYHGRIEHAIEDVAPGDYRIAFPTGKASFFHARGGHEIAVLAYTADSCSDAAAIRAILPASWSGSIGDDGFWVLVNSMDTRATVVATDSAGNQQEFRCERAPLEVAVLYDLRCHVTLPRGGMHTFRIERRSGFNHLPDIDLPVHW